MLCVELCSTSINTVGDNHDGRQENHDKDGGRNVDGTVVKPDLDRDEYDLVQ